MRGKYAVRAALHDAVTTRDEEIAAYRRNIMRLTSERDDLRRQIQAGALAHAKEVRELRAMLDEGTSPRVEALNRELAFVRGERDEAIGKWNSWRRSWGEGTRDMRRHFRIEHGMSDLEASEVVGKLLRLIDWDPEVTPAGDKALVLAAAKTSDSATTIRAIQRARGER